MCKSKRAFTLLEVVMVVLALFILSFVAAPKIGESATKAKIGTCKTTVDLINSQIVLYYTNNECWPVELASMAEDNDFFKNGVPTCPLKQEYSYDVNDRCVEYHSH
jgi:competence protein ComGC